jgi:hypothetical protein
MTFLVVVYFYVNYLDGFAGCTLETVCIYELDGDTICV